MKYKMQSNIEMTDTYKIELCLRRDSFVLGGLVEGANFAIVFKIQFTRMSGSLCQYLVNLGRYHLYIENL